MLITAAALALAACTTAPKGPPAPDPSAFGKYYKDDGPPDKVPDNLAQVPDATPRDEPYHRFANRPYTVFGKSYVPIADNRPLRERGMASWYGRRFHGQKTASGETYDMFAMTAAHKTLPIPSYARVTNTKNGQSVVVRINDRGPFHANRIIDLSYAAATRIGIAAAGSGMVEVERVFDAAPAEQAAAEGKPVPAAVAAAATNPPAAAASAESAALWLQLGAFSSADSAENFREYAARELTWVNEPVQVSARDGLHRVRLGPFRNRTEADAIAQKIRDTLGVLPSVTNR
ncbi:MAG TPA: septal ring lytic transglycosylase RlpA family protein [Usitatibacter sp.]|nr:septal ring lytic transglycosylase RlpA family protein [Usitatibacter sp.]